MEDYQKFSNLRVKFNKENLRLVDKKYIHENFGVLSNTVGRYATGSRAIPLEYLFYKRKAFLRMMKARPVFVTNGGIRVILPLKINQDLAYLAGLICGDGNLLLRKGYYRVSVFNKEKRLLLETLRILKENFNYTGKIENGNKCSFVEVGSIVVYLFFNRIMDIETGRKCNIAIPTKIKEDRLLIRSFIAGFFDAEGSVGLRKNNKTCQILIYQKQKKILDEIKFELSKDDIDLKLYSTGRQWVLYGNRQCLKPFLEKIRFFHPQKRLKLETAVKAHESLQSRTTSSAAKSSLEAFHFQSIC